MNTTLQLTFIGAGNMASAILKGLLANNYSKSALTVCAPLEDELLQIEQQFGLTTSLDNKAPIADSEVIVLCVKPQIMQEVCTEIRPLVQQHKPLVISVAAGINTRQMTEWLGGDNLAVIRCMPNTPAQVKFGATGLYANPKVSEQQQQFAQSLFESVGIALWVKEETDLHTVTALSGSGPAYCFWFLDAMETVATQLGLPAEISRQLAIQTMRGAAELAFTSNESPGQLKQRVMSPGGTTERAIAKFEDENMRAIIVEAMRDAWARSYQLAGESLPKKI